MATTKDWDSIFERVEKDDENKWDTKVKLGSIFFEDGVLNIPGSRTQHERLYVSDHAANQLCDRVGVPGGYYNWVKETDPALADMVLNHGIKEKFSEKEDTTLLLRAKGDVVRAALSDQYIPFDNREFLDVAAKVMKAPFFGHHDIHSFKMSSSGMWLKITLPSDEYPDPSDGMSSLKVGVMLGNSEIGDRSITTDPFLYRALCTNDMMVMKNIRLQQRHTGFDERSLKYKVERVINLSMRKGREAIDRFTSLRTKPVSRPETVIKTIAKDNKLSQRQTDVILSSFGMEDEQNRFGVVNAFTRAAQIEKDYDNRISMERLAGDLVEASDREWELVLA